jgi:anti-sigma factor RsiW
MSDVESRLSELEIAELCALADGSLPPARRAEVEARVAADPALLAVVERQRRALAATAVLADDQPPSPLVAAVSASRATRGRRRRAPRLALGGALAAVAAIVVAVVLTGGPGGPTVADAARLASQPATGPAPAPASPGSTRLAADVEGVPFPDFAAYAGWQVTGVRQGEIDGRSATVVFYEKGGRQIAYVIVAGSALPEPSGGDASTSGGTEYRALQLNGRRAVTWRRGGHTCILLGDASAPELLQLASWNY